MYIRRAIEDTIIRVSEMFPVLLVTGPRQVGKTTVLKKLADSDRNYVSLDDPDVRFFAKSSPSLFLERYTPPVLIDEIQYATELLPYIKIYADEKKKKGQIWLTGSQAFHMMKGVSESLAGRVGIINLLGLSNAEIYGYESEPYTADRERLMKRLQNIQPKNLKEIYARIFKGSMPEIYANDHIDTETYYRSYVETYLQRDVRDLTQVADSLSFYNFMTVVAANTAKPVVYERLAAATGISAPTAKKWLSILLTSQIIALVQPYHNNILKRSTKMPLLHFLDTGLAAHLLRWGNPEALERGAMSGAFFETFVFSEIYKSYINAGLPPPLYYYRDKEKREIDLLIFENATLYPIEIKKAASPGIRSMKNFNALSPLEDSEAFKGIEYLKVNIGSGNIISMTEHLLPIDKRNTYVPAWLI